MDVSSQFNTLLKNFNPITEIISPQLKSVFSFGDDVLNSFNDFFKAKNSQTPVDDLVNFFTELDGKLDKFTDPGMVKGWMQQFAAMPQDIIDSVMDKLGDGANFLMKNFSASIASITRPENYKDESTTPSVNVKNSLLGVIDTGMKLPGYIEENLSSLASSTKTFLNKNLSGVAGDLATSAISHGANLVADSLHVDRFTSILSSYLSNATGVFGNASGFVEKVINYTPFAGTNVAAPVLELTEKVEGLSINLTAAGKDIIDLPSKAISLLKSPIS